MSFNIRFGTARDGPNRWELRRDLVFDRIRAFDPDLLGAQEVLEFQADELSAGLPDYTFVGRGREDGRRRGEMMGIFVRRERFEVEAEGHFWLSEAPHVPGSIGWDAGLPRLVSWVRLVDRTDRDGELVFLNTHLDVHGPEARIRSAELIRSHLGQISESSPVVLTGDFNTKPFEGAYRVLTEDTREPRLFDAHIGPHSAVEETDSTCNGFGASRMPGTRIDWILHSEHLLPIAASIDRTRPLGRFPSDHDPVTAVFARLG